MTEEHVRVLGSPVVNDRFGVAGQTRLIALMDGRVEVERIWMGQRDTVVCPDADAALAATARSLAGDSLS